MSGSARAMPTYEYRCRDCGREFDIFQRMSDQPGAPCPGCGRQAERLISGGAGFLFRGDGFYITDYRSEEYRKKVREEADGGDGQKAEGKSDKEGAKASPGEAGPSAGDRTGAGKRERGGDGAPAGSPSGSGGETPGREGG